ncbi:hydratase [Paracoccus limosus]|uniref:Hydratase n=1 Tax=Paracoccus limosus TaxID=913252 RepID=A0A844H400_9RHOB|nr:hydratase [Paracoccus limosus]MTH34200.1 hydratase [Paracoccus limosus]
MRVSIACASLALLAQPALAACPDVSLMQNAARGWIAGQRLVDPLVWNMQDARCAYDSFRGVLQAQLGPPVGVKIGMTSTEAQRRYGIAEPIAGALFAPMLRPDGSRLSLAGSRNPLYEADLVVTVASPAIMQARTREDVVRALRDVRPFIELPDLAWPQGQVPTAPLLAAYGGLPWRGVLGKPVPISELADPVADLAQMQVVLKVNGTPVARGRGDQIMGHPLDALLWLVQWGGYDLGEGSVVSLGSLSSLGRALPGQRIEAEYILGGHPMRVAVTLVP